MHTKEQNKNETTKSDVNQYRRKRDTNEQKIIQRKIKIYIKKTENDEANVFR